MKWQDLLFLAMIYGIGFAPPYLAGRFLVRPRAWMIAAAWVIPGLWLVSKGSGPHGYGLLFMVPFWIGWLCGVATLLAPVKSKGA